MFDAVYRPGVALGSYPEKKFEQRPALESFIGGAMRRLRARSGGGLSDGEKFVAEVMAASDQFEELNEEDFKARCFDLRLALQHKGYERELIIQSFALIREASGRILGKRHFQSQLLGGWALLKGHVAEMQTGEGKTLTTLLPACTAAMAGVPVHVVTANDYLAARDAESLLPVFDWFGLTVGVVNDEVSEPAERKAAYACNVLYCSPSQVAFDYLRDRMTMGERRNSLDHKLRKLTQNAKEDSPLLMRGLCFAIVDEADSVLIDDACTPLILSAQSGEPPAPEPFEWALKLAAQLKIDEEIVVNNKYRDLAFTNAGTKRLNELLDTSPPPDKLTRSAIEASVKQALQAIHCYRRDYDYLVRDGHIELIDSNTGRAKPDHAWERGLHQMVEAKEKCELTAPRTTIARMSYQRFFRRYLHLSGMSGTVSEVAEELYDVYGLEVVAIPPNKKNKRQAYGEAIYVNTEAKFNAIAERAVCLQRSGRATLIGTQTLAESEALSAALSTRAIEHTVLNARQDKAEAEIVGRGGEPGSVMVATNMAGRGTDIELADSVKEAGGLHVIVAGRNISGRVDRQLIGRSARQGDPGSWQAILSLEDEVLKDQLAPTLTGLARKLTVMGVARAGRLAIWGAQRLAEKQGKAQRRSVLRFDEQSKERLGFSGAME